MYSVSDETRKPIFEGVQGENESREIQFDISSWIEELGEGACTATAKRPTDTIPYPVTVTRSGNVVTWKPNSTDTAIEGIGAFQLEYSINGSIAKTRIWNTKIAPSLDPAGDPPDPYDNWLAEMRQIAADALQDAQGADASAQDAEAWAKGTKNGTPVSSSDAQYQNNSKYFAEESYKNAEAWAVGQHGGVDVPSTDPAYENNAKYWAEQSLANQYGAFIVKSAEGNIASFNDGADNVPMKSVKVAIVPKQSGSGDPSPSNVRPITGTSTVNVTVAGFNLLDESLFLEASGWQISNGYYTGAWNAMFAKYNQTGLWKNESGYTGRICVSWVGYGGGSGCRFQINYTDGTNSSSSITATERHEVLLSTAGKVVDSIGVNYSSSGTVYLKNVIFSFDSSRNGEYEPFTGHITPVPLGQTVYGGEVDVATGVLTLTHGMKYYDGTATPYDVTTNFGTGYNRASYLNTQSDAKRGTAYAIMLDKFAYSNSYYLGLYKAHINENGILLLGIPDTITSVAQMKTWAGQNPFTVVYELATPTTVQLAPTQVATLLGTNNVWADCGAVEVEYRADPTLAYNELANVIVSLGGNI